MTTYIMLYVAVSLWTFLVQDGDRAQLQAALLWPLIILAYWTAACLVY